MTFYTSEGTRTSTDFFVGSGISAAIGTAGMLTAYLALNAASGGAAGILVSALSIGHLINAAVEATEGGIQLATDDSLPAYAEMMISGSTSMIVGAFFLATAFLALNVASGGIPAILLTVAAGLSLAAGAATAGLGAVTAAISM